MPPEVDPCAERGEFHTVAWAGPMFHYPILVESGEIVERDGFVFADVRLAE
jgi:diphthamide synthase (EF-2-diphthine--ammonia ligase)